LTEAFYAPLGGGRYRASELTCGPWDPDSQHAGPPAALLGGALQTAVDGGFLARVTFEILRPVPIGDLTVATEVVRPGRSVRLVEGTLADDDGRVLLARAWSIRREPVDLPRERADADPEPARPTPPDHADPKPFFAVPWDVGYHTAMEFRFARGGFLEPGPAFAWLRPRVPVVAGEAVTPLQRVLVAADTGSGLSASLPIDDWLFINTDLTVHLHREPRGEWVGFDAATTLEDDGVGLATTVVHDETGLLGRGLQSLLVARA
jgi:hypothetical protein